MLNVIIIWTIWVFILCCWLKDQSSSSKPKKCKINLPNVSKRNVRMILRNGKIIYDN